MIKPRVYILQVLCILVLVCGYLLSDQPDSLSVMHFDPNPACPSFFVKATKTADNVIDVKVSPTSQNNNPRKTSVPKFFSNEVILPCKAAGAFHPYDEVAYTFALPENYSYLFYEEINPPPPKVS